MAANMTSFFGGFVMGQVFGRRNNITDPVALSRLELVGGLFGFSPRGILITSMLAQRLSPAIPPPPTGLVASPSKTNGLVLAWNASDGATSYNVKRGTTKGGPYPTIIQTSTISLQDTSLIDAGQYFYVVSARNAAGESTNSNEVLFKFSPPAPPVSVAGPTHGHEGKESLHKA